MFYNTHDDFFDLFTNSSFAVKGAYLENEESFKRLQDILKQKSIKDLTLVDASLFDIDKVLEGKKYKYIYLSNVLDFSDYYFNDCDYVESKEKFNKTNLILIYKRIFLSFDKRFFKGLIKSFFI